MPNKTNKPETVFLPKAKRQAAYGGYCDMSRSMGLPVKPYAEFEYEDMVEVRARFKSRRKDAEGMSEPDMTPVIVQKWAAVLMEAGFDEHPQFTNLALYCEMHDTKEKERATAARMLTTNKFVDLNDSMSIALASLHRIKQEYNLRIIHHPVHKESQFELPVDEFYGISRNKRLEGDMQLIYADMLDTIPTVIGTRMNLEVMRADSVKKTPGPPTLWVHMVPEQIILLQEGPDVRFKYFFRFFAR